MERFDKFLDEANEGYTEQIANFIYNEYGYFLQLSAAFPNLNPKWRYFSVAQQVFMMMILIFTIYSQIITTVTLLSIDVTYASQAGHMLCGCIFAVVLSVLLSLNRSKLNVFFSYNYENFYSYGESFVNDKLDNWKIEMKRFKLKMVKALALYLVIAGSFPIVGVPLLNYYYEVEQADEINGIHMYLPVPLYIPFPANFWGKLFGYALEIGVSFCLTTTVGTAILFIIFSVETFITQLKILLLSIKKLEERAINQCWIKYKKKVYPFSCYEDEDFLEEYNRCIKQNVEHHKIIIRCFEIIDHIQRWPMFVAAFLISIVVALALFILIQGETRIAPQILSLMLLGLETVTIATLCERAQKMIDLGEDVFEAFYNLKWMDCNKSIKNSILIVNEHNRSPMVLRAGGITRVDMELFASICNSVYSYVNLMYAAQKG